MDLLVSIHVTDVRTAETFYGQAFGLSTTRRLCLIQFLNSGYHEIATPT